MCLPGVLLRGHCRAMVVEKDNLQKISIGGMPIDGTTCYITLFMLIG
jgi:hypothetical protein